MTQNRKWFGTERITCGDTAITEYQTDGKPTPTAPQGAWTRMRGTDRDGVIRTFERAGDAWAEVATERRAALTVPPASEHDPRYPIGTPEYAAYATELRAELAKWTNREPPYDR